MAKLAGLQTYSPDYDLNWLLVITALVFTTPIYSPPYSGSYLARVFARMSLPA
ncbi:hypothetical protein B9Z19DRAFT_1132085 [Tuber borchii]|uniref:Uncharacterized protein n=1 Tax=Tuber borchii TaxID=42251 RepID=A0A2T6ZHS8_TUBBO|nr:hypothetical protein B9Z19DRAFT_1132085 [Tuber borchii]